MVGYKRDIFSTIGLLFVNFISGQHCNLQLLRAHKDVLNDLIIRNMIESNEYDELQEVLDKAIDFFTP